MKNILGILSIVVGISTYVYLIWRISRSTSAGLSLTTFLLWSLLAWITTITTFTAKGNPAVPFIYALGASTTTIVLFCKGKTGWKSFDSLIAGLVMLCLMLWFSKGTTWALTLSVVAAVIAAIPLIEMAWKKPAVSPIVANSGFFLANILSFAAAKAWTLEDRLYPGANIIVCGLMVLPWIKHKHFRG